MLNTLSDHTPDEALNAPLPACSIEEGDGPSQAEIDAFRDGIFALRTRRFGTVAEIMISQLTGAGKGKNIFHDLFDNADTSRIEVKFATVSSKHKEVITVDNLFEAVSEAGKPRSVVFDKWQETSFLCNIQQIKSSEFDQLYYGLFFHDRILIFRMSPEQILSDPAIGYCNKQHKGNVGEGQFAMTPKSLGHHLDHYLELDLTYADLIELLKASKRAS